MAVVASDMLLTFSAMYLFSTGFCRVLLAAIFCFTTLSAEAGITASAPYSQEFRNDAQRDDSRAEEWQRREILDSHNHTHSNSIDMNANPYVLLVVLPLIGFILLVALIRMNDF